MSKEYHKGKPSEKTEEIVYKGKEVQAISTLFYFNLHLYYSSNCQDARQLQSSHLPPGGLRLLLPPAPPRH